MADTKKKGSRKIGRGKRRLIHRLGNTCGVKGCAKMRDSRYYDEALKAYVAR